MSRRSAAEGPRLSCTILNPSRPRYSTANKRRIATVPENDPVDTIEKQRAIGQAGERVVEGFEKQPLFGLAFLFDEFFSFQRLRHRMRQPAQAVL